MPNKIATRTSFKAGASHRYWKGGEGNYWRREARKIVNCPKEKIVHHIDGNFKNNKLDNLQVITQSEHMKIHHKQRVYYKRPNSILRKNINKVIKLRKEKLTYQQIAKLLKINFRMVKRCIVTYNKLNLKGGNLKYREKILQDHQQDLKDQEMEEDKVKVEHLERELER